VFGHAKQGASCGDTKAAGKQVLTNGPSSLAGAISPTAVPERSLGCGAGCVPFRRRRSTDDRPAPATARTAGGADPCVAIAPMTGTRASPPAVPVSGSSWRSLRPGAIGAIDGHAWTLVHYPGAVDDPDAGEWISCRTRRNRLDRLRLQPCRPRPVTMSNRNRRNCLLRCRPLTSRCGFCVWDPLPHLAQLPENLTSWGSSPCRGPSKPDRAGLEPRDILVMCPDTETYALLIVAGFGLGDVVHGADPAHRLRVRLADRSLVPTNALLVVAS
jgi:hypothetical protein